MTHTRVFTIEGSSVASGGTETLTDSDDESWVIREIRVEEEGNNSMDGSTATISIAGDSVTDQNVPIELLRHPDAELQPWDLDWPSNRQFEFDWTNNSSGSLTVNVVLVVEPMEGGRS